MTRLSRREALTAGAALALIGCSGQATRAKPAPASTREDRVQAIYDGQQLSRQTYDAIRFDRCTFDKITGRSRKTTVEPTEFHECTFTKCRFDDCSFVGAVFSRCHFTNCSFKRGALDDVLFLDSKTRSLTFDNTAINVSFEGGELERVFLSGCKIAGLSFKALTLADLTLTECGEVQKLLFTAAEVRDAVIADTNLDESAINQTQLRNSRFSNGRYYMFEMLESTVDHARFEKLLLVGANISDTRFIAPKLDDVTFSKFLIAQSTTFENARFVRPVLEEGVRVKTEKMVIDGGERFPGT